MKKILPKLQCIMLDFNTQFTEDHLVQFSQLMVDLSTLNSPVGVAVLCHPDQLPHVYAIMVKAKYTDLEERPFTIGPSEDSWTLLDKVTTCSCLISLNLNFCDYLAMLKSFIISAIAEMEIDFNIAKQSQKFRLSSIHFHS